MMNHHPVQQGIWFPYDGGRYKDYYDLRLKTGEVVENAYPNGNSWYRFSGGNGRPAIKDDEVAEIRLKPDCEIHRWGMKGQNRIKRTLSLFAEWVPPWPEGFPTMEQLATEDQVESQEIEEDRLEEERNKAKALLEYTPDTTVEYKGIITQKPGDGVRTKDFYSLQGKDDHIEVPVILLTKPLAKIDMTQALAKQKSKEAKISAAEEKRKRRQCRNLRNAGKAGD